MEVVPDIHLEFLPSAVSIHRPKIFFLSSSIHILNKISQYNRIEDEQTFCTLRAAGSSPILLKDILTGKTHSPVTRLHFVHVRNVRPPYCFPRIFQPAATLLYK